MIRILIADDHQMFVQGLKTILSDDKRFLVSATAGNGLEALQQLRSTPIDVLLIDINMPVLNGYEATLLAAREFPQLSIMALSMIADKTSVLKMLEAGVRGYIFKNADEQELKKAIETVVQEAYYVTPEMEPVLQTFLRKQKDIRRGYEKHEPRVLSQREIEILKLIIDGFTNHEIAEQLFLSTRTVDTHRKNILSKLQLRNTAALVRFSLENKAFLGLD